MVILFAEIFKIFTPMEWLLIIGIIVVGWYFLSKEKK